MGKLKRNLFVAGWTIVALFGWIYGLGGGLMLYVYGEQHYGWPLLSRWIPDSMDWILMDGLFGVGTLSVTVGTLILGMKGKLPGTRRSSPVQPGFPITPNVLDVRSIARQISEP